MFEFVIDLFYKINDFFCEISDWILDKLSDLDITTLTISIFFTLNGYFTFFILPKIMGFREYGVMEKIIISIVLPFLSYFIVKKML